MQLTVELQVCAYVSCKYVRAIAGGHALAFFAAIVTSARMAPVGETNQLEAILHASHATNIQRNDEIIIPPETKLSHK